MQCENSTKFIYFPGTQTGTECCGSIIDFENNTSPTGAFQRITAGPAFYVAKGKWQCLIFQIHFNKVSSFQATVSPRIFLHPTGFQIFPLCLKMMTVFPSISLGQLQEGIMIREKVSTLSTFIKFFVINELMVKFKKTSRNHGKMWFIS